MQLVRNALYAVLILSCGLSAQTPDCAYTLQRTPLGAILVARNGSILQDADYTRSGSNLRTITPNSWNDQDKITFYYTAGQTLTVPTVPPGAQTVYLPNKENKTCTGTVNPPPSTAQITRQQCVGSGVAAGTAFDCSGIEFWTVTAAGTTQVYAVVSATDSMLGLPPCPAPPNAAVCLQPAALGDAPLRLTADYNEPQMSINGYEVIPWNSGGRCDWMPHCLLTVP